MRTYSGILTELPSNGIFVFGSNTQGRHGKGAALVAKNKFGAIYGQSMGYQGQSYAIVTKDLTKKVHPSIDKFTIQYQIGILYHNAIQNPENDFYIAYSGNGTNLNGYTPEEMTFMFKNYVNIDFEVGEWGIPDNIIFEENFAKLIENG